MNIAYEAVDRHVAHGLGDKITLRWIGQDDNIRDLSTATCIGRPTGLPTLFVPWISPRATAYTASLGRVPELYVAALGALKAGAVFCPLFSAFRPEPIKARMSIGEAKLLVTTEHFYRRKIAPWRNELGRNVSAARLRPSPVPLHSKRVRGETERPPVSAAA